MTSPFNLSPTHRLVGRWLPGLLALAALSLLYGLTLQQDINGGSHDYVLDTGEMQVALNLWGTIHYTGYPLYTILSALLTRLFVALGAAPALAASFTSLLWSLLALWLFYLILRRLLPDNPILTALILLVFGLAETVWLHSVITEVYSFSLLLTALVIYLGMRLSERWEKGLWLLLIFVLGTAVAHHRILLFLLLPTLLLTWPNWVRFPYSLSRRSSRAYGTRNTEYGTRNTEHGLRLSFLLQTLIVFLLPFAAYLYLPLRAHQGAIWVYGQPGTWPGFWQQFTGSEVAGGLLRLPDTLDSFLANLQFLTDHLTQQFPWILLLAGLAGLLWLLRNDWRVGLAFLSGAVILPAFIFLFPRAVWAPAVLMPALLSLAAGVAYLLHRLVDVRPALRYAGWATCLALSAFLLVGNLPFVNALTRDPAGRAMVERLRPLAAAADRPTVALPWGAGFFAAAYGLYVTGELSGMTLVDHRADFAAILAADGRILTPALYLDYWPPAWWEARVGPAHYQAVTPEIVAIQQAARPPDAAPPNAAFDLGNGIRLHSAALSETTPGQVEVTLIWEATQPPNRDYSVAVHWLTQFPPQSPDDLVAQADSAHPVQGWSPTSRWTTGELVRDVYALETTAVAQPTVIAIAMYYQDESGQFVNSPWFVLEP